jgi:hypothetical protein
MEAFKKHGVSNLKDLSVEFMVNFVHNDLIPRLMVKRRHKHALCLMIMVATGVVTTVL